MKYRNVSGDARTLRVSYTPDRFEVVEDGAVVEVTDQACIDGLVGQESVFEPAAPARKVKE